MFNFLHDMFHTAVYRLKTHPSWKPRVRGKECREPVVLERLILAFKLLLIELQLNEKR